MLIKGISLRGSHWLIREKTNLINIDTMFYNPFNAFIKPSDDNQGSLYSYGPLRP